MCLVNLKLLHDFICKEYKLIELKKLQTSWEQKAISNVSKRVIMVNFKCRQIALMTFGFSNIDGNLKLSHLMDFRREN